LIPKTKDGPTSRVKSLFTDDMLVWDVCQQKEAEIVAERDACGTLYIVHSTDETGVRDIILGIMESY
jgi:hypothetical protein